MIINKIQESNTRFFQTTPTNHIFLKAVKPEFQNIEVWFTDQNSQPFEI